MILRKFGSPKAVLGVVFYDACSIKIIAGKYFFSLQINFQGLAYVFY